MRVYWHKKDNNSKLLIFFNGWGCDEYILTGVQSTNLDIVIISDYTDIDVECLDQFNTYEDVVLLAWSFGVYIAQMLSPHLPQISRSIAVNGSCYPVDDNLGIPVHVFNTTLQSYDEKNRERFFLRIMGGKKELIRYEKSLPNRKTEDQRWELYHLSSLFQSGVTYDIDLKKLNWDIVLITSSDKIFPLENLKRAWDEKAILIEGEHFPDFQYIFDHYISC